MSINILQKTLETYINLYIPKKKEKFDENGNAYNEELTLYNIIMSIIIWLINGFAIYLSFKCSNGFSIGPFLLAILFPPFYILYHIFSTNLCGLI
jgi:hypothetical protein